MERVLVTGVTGRLGPNVAKALAEKGYKVRGFALPDDPGRGKLASLDMELFDGDLTDAEACARAVEGMDRVVHCAAIMEDIPEGMGMASYFDVNTRGTFALLQAAADNAVKKFVYLSTTATYDVWVPHEMPIREETEQHPTHIYGVTKLANEALCRAFFWQRGLRYSILRPNWIMTPDEFVGDTFSVGWVVGCLRHGLSDRRAALYVEGATDAWKEIDKKHPDKTRLCIPRDPSGRSWMFHCTDVRDVVEAVLLCLENNASDNEDFDVAAREPMPWDEVVPHLAEKKGQEYVEVETPSAWRFSFSNEKLKRLLGFEPRYGYREMADDGLRMKAGDDLGLVRAGAG